MSLPQNIYPLTPNPVKKRSNELDREYIRVRQRITAGLKDGRFSLRGVAQKTGVSYGYISMFLKGFQVSPRILRRIKIGLKMTLSPKPRNRKDKRIFPGPGYWIKDAI